MRAKGSARRLGPGAVWIAPALLVLLTAGCAHRPQTAAAPATAPPVVPTPGTPPSPSPSAPATAAGPIPVTELPEGGISEEDREFVRAHTPIYSETGQATWYVAPYKGRKAANGEIFRDDALTAAHRTLPMGSLVVVTNLTTRQASAMRISDRGPFVPDKTIDLTIASAKAIGLYHMGTAPVRIDVYQTPKPIATGGRWCVQIGAFKSEERADKMKAALLRAYPRARVIEFSGEASFWVRIRPVGDSREEAERIVRRVRPTQGDAYLTRLD